MCVIDNVRKIGQKNGIKFAFKSSYTGQMKEDFRGKDWHLEAGSWNELQELEEDERSGPSGSSPGQEGLYAKFLLEQMSAFGPYGAVYYNRKWDGESSQYPL